METGKLKKFAQKARRELIEQVGARLGQVLAEDSLARRQQPDVVRKLHDEIQAHGEPEVIERAAYIWFNRFCALRFMDSNHYNRVGVVSPAEGQTQPEILAEAKSGHVDETMVPESVRKRVLALLSGQESSRDPQGQAYRLLLVAVCNHWHQAMPFLFERIADYTELLMPDDLLSESAILDPMRGAMTVEACRDVEVIGWLYQFYISEKKEQVFAALKKSKKITPENIPAATQLFTPHWIVRYLVENSLGRLWMLNRPSSRLVEQMDYYIKPEEPETDFLKISSPEEVRICDPACGSGHMLTYAFDLLYAIYEEEGYSASEIPGKILTHNLYGVEIDERAGALAAFALTMKARARQRRFFNKDVNPNICVLENLRFDENELKDYMDFIGRDLFTARLETTLRQFEEADNFGSLIRPEVTDVDGIVRILESKDVSGQLFLGVTHQKVRQALQQADYLGPKYHVVIANPPYMGSKGMNGRLTAWAKEQYQHCWDRGTSDLYAMFIDRAVRMTLQNGATALIAMQGWMFTSSFEMLRSCLLSDNSLVSAIHLGARAFDSIAGPVVSTVAFVFQAKNNKGRRGYFFRLTSGENEESKRKLLVENIQTNKNRIRFTVNSKIFKKIPGSPVSYWISNQQLISFETFPLLSSIANFKAGLSTGDNTRFQRVWYEVDLAKVAFGCESLLRLENRKWVPCNSGGAFRKWYGNNEIIIFWENNGEAIKKFKGSAIRNEDEYLKPGLTYNKISSGEFACREKRAGFIFDDTGRAIVCDRHKIHKVQALLSSTVAHYYLDILAPTLSFTSKELERIPFSEPRNIDTQIVKPLLNLSRLDWDAYETSWDFTSLPLLSDDYRQPTLKASYQKLCAHWREMTLEMRRLEEENNRIFIEAYGLQDELTPEVPLSKVTLTCNPHYRYGNDRSEDELEMLLLTDTMRELISYAAGCMLGRYSLDKPGLILANQGETIEDYLRQVPKPSFEPDGDNVIPILDAAWFTDGIVERFREFLKVTFGTEHYEENLKFIESALGKNIRKYFLNDFYKDHVRLYKKRPIYWLFSSPKGSFNALIYMHRYRSDTVSVILNDYLREFRTKLGVRLGNLEEVEASTDASKRDKTTAAKEINQIRNTLDELEDWERKVMLPLAEQKIVIDLDDGVKANYPKFGAALKQIPGLSA